MNRRLSIERSDVWSTSEGSQKRSNLKRSTLFKDICQQNRVQRHSLVFFGWHFTLARVWARKTKVFPEKSNSSSKALPNEKCGALNTCIYFTVVLFYSTDQSSSLDAVFYSIGLRSLYVDQGLKKATQIFSIRTTVEKIKINDISA